MRYMITENVTSGVEGQRATLHRIRKRFRLDYSTRTAFRVLHGEIIVAVQPSGDLTSML